MSINNSNNDEENSVSAADSYQSGAGEINAGTSADTINAVETFDRIGTAAAEFDVADSGALNKNLNNVQADLSDDLVNDDSPVKWLIPLVIIFLLIVIGYAFCGKTVSSTDASHNALYYTSSINIV